MGTFFPTTHSSTLRSYTNEEREREMGRTPKVKHVKRAYKDHPEAGIKKGDEYWFQETRMGGRFVKRIFKRAPRRSQLTGSDFWSAFYRVQESLEKQEPKTTEEFNALLGRTRKTLEGLRDKTSSRYDNLPASIQRGSVGNLLSSRTEALTGMLADLPTAMEDGEDVRERTARLREALGTLGCE